MIEFVTQLHAEPENIRAYASQTRMPHCRSCLDLDVSEVAFAMPDFATDHSHAIFASKAVETSPRTVITQLSTQRAIGCTNSMMLARCIHVLNSDWANLHG